VQKFNKGKEYVYILLSNYNLFFGAYEVIVDAFYYVIQFTGPEKEFSQFKYKFALDSEAEEITVCNVASSYSMDVKEVTVRVNVSRCSAARSKDEDKNLQFHIDILKVKDAHKIMLL
jgi:hypothetical protein